MLRAEICLVTALFACGVIGGMIYLWPTPNIPADSARDAAGNFQYPANNGQGPASGPYELGGFDRYLNQIPIGAWTADESDAGLLEQGDRNLLAGNFASASKCYRQILDRSAYQADPLTLLRLGISSEYGDDPDSARSAYLRAVQGTNNPLVKQLSALGLCRVLNTLGENADSLNVLAEMFLHDALLVQLAEEVRAELIYQLASTLQDRALSGFSTVLWEPQGVAFHQTLPEISQLHELLTRVNEVQATGHDHAAEQPKSGINLVQRPGNSMNLITVDVDTGVQPVSLLIDQLAATTQLKVLISDAAYQAMQGRAQSVAVKGTKLSLIFDTLLIPLELFWYQTENEVQIACVEEVAGVNQPQLFWAQAADRMYRLFNFSYPGDHRQFAAILSRANLRLLQHDYDGASTHFKELQQLKPKDELLAKMFFSRGKLHLALGRNQEAIQDFYSAIDQTFDHQLQSISYWLAGQINLEMSRWEPALAAAGRALSLANTDQQRCLPALTLARSYLLTDNPLAANQVLFDARTALSAGKARPVATVLAAYARYLGGNDLKGKQIAGERLLTALSQSSADDFPSFIDLYLAGHAYRDLGFHDVATSYLAAAAASTDIADWQRRIMYELALAQRQSGQLDGAAEVFQQLAEEINDPWSINSRLQLAELFLVDNKIDDCLEICQQIDQAELNEQQKQEFLRTLGNAYGRLNQPFTAALCYAGLLPDNPTK